MVPSQASSALQQRHPRNGERRVAALVALVAARPGQRLLHVSQVITPKAQGTPVSSWTSWIPRADSAQTKSKWSVSPRITTPRQATPANSPVLGVGAWRRSGSS